MAQKSKANLPARALLLPESGKTVPEPVTELMINGILREVAGLGSGILLELVL